jgi:hypothetical protein
LSVNRKSAFTSVTDSWFNYGIKESWGRGNTICRIVTKNNHYSIRRHINICLTALQKFLQSEQKWILDSERVGGGQETQ